MTNDEVREIAKINKSLADTLCFLDHEIMAAVEQHAIIELRLSRLRAARAHIVEAAYLKEISHDQEGN